MIEIFFCTVVCNYQNISNHQFSWNTFYILKISIFFWNTVYILKDINLFWNSLYISKDISLFWNTVYISKDVNLFWNTVYISKDINFFLKHPVHLKRYQFFLKHPVHHKRYHFFLKHPVLSILLIWQVDRCPSNRLVAMLSCGCDRKSATDKNACPDRKCNKFKHVYSTEICNYKNGLSVFQQA